MMKLDCVDVDLLPAGTPQYMSPEHMFEPETTEARSDLFSLAAVAYFALTRRTPFDADSMQGLYFAIDGGTFPRPSELRAELPAPSTDGSRRLSPTARGTASQMRAQMADALYDAVRALPSHGRRDDRGRRRRPGLHDDPDDVRAQPPPPSRARHSQEGNRRARACSGGSEHARVAELRPRGPGGERIDQRRAARRGHRRPTGRSSDDRRCDGETTGLLP